MARVSVFRGADVLSRTWARGVSNVPASLFSVALCIGHRVTRAILGACLAWCGGMSVGVVRWHTGPLCGNEGGPLPCLSHWG